MAQQRNFSFETRDDDPSYHSLPAPAHDYSNHTHLDAPQPYYPPRRPENSTRSDASWEAVSAPSDISDISDTESSSPVRLGQQGTVIRKPVPPAAAAAAAAALAPVRKDLAPRLSPHGYHQDARGLYNEPTHPSMPMVHIPPTMSAQWDADLGSPSSARYNDPVLGEYSDNPYKRMSTTWDPAISQSGFDGAHDVLSDDDDNEYHRGRGGAVVGAAAGSGAAVAMGLRGGAVESGGLLPSLVPVEKSDWLRKKERSSKKAHWVIWIFLAVLILGAAAGTAAGVIISKNKKNASGSSSPTGGAGLTAAEDVAQNGDLDKNSAEIKALLNNPSLHKVFHGMDYTPLGGIYPDCLTWPATQNNITRDIAVMSLLTDKIRLYGNDCNQTEMVMHSIDRLGVDMKVWLGVWLDSNATTNTRQLAHLYTLLDNKGYHDKFDGVAVGNEVLFAESLTETQLFNIIDGVRTNLTTLGYHIPVGTSDLGSNWNSKMASQVDVLMANVHPFFAGVVVEKAANWTYNYFMATDVSTTIGLTPLPRVMISEVGWPSGGGNDSGSVAGIDEMNLFMSDFVCQENARGTEYFWFSAFDEPWKIKFNEPKLNKEWEDKWGLMDVNRNLKQGLKIPDCK